MLRERGIGFRDRGIDCREREGCREIGIGCKVRQRNRCRERERLSTIRERRFHMSLLLLF